jgi:hypothetical protein
VRCSCPRTSSFVRHTELMADVALGIVIPQSVLQLVDELVQ